ncbi:MAG TPA: DUF1643 domain-containing protein, partial [Rhizorhapis sp.]|nr:DUF1643 domain-containing protein [Rhizorhapis sp.]
MVDLTIRRSAIISADEIYRPRLDRILRRQGRIGLFLGVNPSKADGRHDDHSVRKMYGFSNRLDIARFMVGNLFD